MKIIKFIVAIIYVFSYLSINLSINAMEVTKAPTEEAIHYYRIEDTEPKEIAEDFYDLKINSSPNPLGQDSWGEDIFYDPVLLNFPYFLEEAD